jgi:AcrR family transcriptional regulator
MSKELARPRGRPRNFDEREALEKAVRVFWTKGYDAVTIDDLVAGMGVVRPSLYAIFGDKATLFMRCLEAYAEHLGAGASKALLGPPRVSDGIRDFLSHIVESATTDDSPRGCLVGCVAPAVDDPKVRDFLARANARAVALVEQRLRRGVDAGELPRDFPTATRARQVVDLSRGLVIRARVGVSRAELLRDAKDAAALVLEPKGAQPRGKRTPHTPGARQYETKSRS